MNIRYFLLSLFIAMLLFSTGCMKTAEPSYFSYAKQPFRAEINGTLNGVRFSAEIGKDVPHDQSKPFTGIWIRYIEPQSIASLEARYDDKECLMVSIGGISCTCEATSIDGLLRPLQVLLENATPITVQKENGETILTMSDYILKLATNGIPISVEGTAISFKTVWWEPIKTP